MWVSIYFGLLLALPVILWQAWAFFIPAFDRSHTRMMRLFVVLASVLLVAGVLFGYYVTLPAALKFLTNYDSNIYNAQIQARPFITFCTHVLLAMALVFELPIFVVGLTRTGVLTTERLRKNRRIGYFVICCIAVALPGVDPVTTTFEAIPLLSSTSSRSGSRCGSTGARDGSKPRSSRDLDLRRLGPPRRRPAAPRRAASRGRARASSRSARGAASATSTGRRSCRGS